MVPSPAPCWAMLTDKQCIGDMHARMRPYRVITVSQATALVQRAFTLALRFSKGLELPAGSLQTTLDSALRRRERMACSELTGAFMSWMQS
jgi:hypothetical protein